MLRDCFLLCRGGSAGVLCLFDLLNARFAAWRCTHEAPLRSIAFSASASLVAAISSKVGAKCRTAAAAGAFIDAANSATDES